MKFNKETINYFKNKTERVLEFDISNSYSKNYIYLPFERSRSKHSLELQNFIKEEYGWNLLSSKNKITVLCNICGKKKIISIKYAIDVIDSHYFLFFACGLKENKSCFDEKQKQINAFRVKLNKSPATNRVVSEEEKEKRNASMIKLGHYKAFSEKRKGKSYEDVYGDKAFEAKEKIKARRALQSGNLEPHLGKKHSQESKDKIINKIKIWQEGEAKNKNWIHPITKEKVNFFEYSSESKKYKYANLSQEERERRTLMHAKRFWEKDFKPYLYTKTGYVLHWHLGTKEYFESSYEEAYFNILNFQKKYWKKNKTIYMPYIHPKDNRKHYYCPDVTIWEDESYKVLKEITEVKPSEFVENKKNKSSEYYLVTQKKLNALKEFCFINNLTYNIVTEKELNLNENKKNLKNNI